MLMYPGKMVLFSKLIVVQFIGNMIPLDGQIYCVQTYVNNRKTIFISRLMILKRFKGFILFMFKGYLMALKRGKTLDVLNTIFRDN